MSRLGALLEQTWTQITSFVEAEVSQSPEIFTAIVVIILGFAGGKIVSELIRNILQATALDDAALRFNVQSFLRKAGYRGKLSDFVADIVKVTIYLLALLSLFYLSGSPAAAQYSTAVVELLFTVLTVMAALFLGLLISGWLEDVTVHILRAGRITGLVDETSADIPVYIVAGKAVKYVGILVTFFIALGLAGVSFALVNLILGIIGLGIVAAVVLGTRDLVRNMLLSVYFQISDVFRGGTRFTVDGYEGDISSVRPLYTVLEDDGKEVYIPNTELVSRIIEREEG